MKIGVLSESFRLPLAQAIQQAQALCLDGLQLYAVGDELNCGKISNTDLQQIKSRIASSGLEISALCGDLGGYGFSKEEENPKKIETSKQIVELACRLDTKVITTHIGVVPKDTKCKEYYIMQHACNSLAEYAHKCGVLFAVETGPEKAETLKAFLDSLKTSGIAVNFDPANFVMVTQDDPVKAVFTLKDYIVHTHAKDGICIKPTDPKIIYDFFAQGGIGDLRLENCFLEMPIGKGNVDWNKYITALKEINYQGFLTIEREVGPSPQQDIMQAVSFLKKYL